MRNLLPLTALVVGMSSVASAGFAADLGPYNRGGSIKDSPAPAADYQRPFSWSGFYLGAQVGYAFGETNAESGPIAGFNQTYRYDNDGVVGGAHAGFNWQTANLVFGIETDIEGANIKGSGTGSLGLPHETEVQWVGSTRGRLGIAYDRSLFYATAGVAYGDVKIDKGFASYSETRVGYTVGAGVEQAISDRMTLRLEYRYTDLGEGNFKSTPLNSIDKSEVDFHAIRAGFSFKF
jgi:outer membrane immunogenic protein